MSYHPSWQTLDPQIARQLHDGYVAGHPERLRRFLEWARSEGFDTTELETFESFRSLDRLWTWLVTRGELPNHEPLDRSQAKAQGGPAWWPWMDGVEPPADWPVWFRPWLPIDALELVSGLAACVNELLLRGYEARWEFVAEGAVFDTNQTHLAFGGRVWMVERMLDRDYFFGCATGFMTEDGEPQRPVWALFEDFLQESGMFAPRPDVAPPALMVEADIGPGGFMIAVDDAYCGEETDIVDRFVRELRRDHRIREAERTHREQVDVRTVRALDTAQVIALADQIWEQVVSGT